MFSLLDLVLLFMGAFGFGYGLAERSNRKSLAVLSRRVDALMRLAKEKGQSENRDQVREGRRKKDGEED